MLMKLTVGISPPPLGKSLGPSSGAVALKFLLVFSFWKLGQPQLEGAKFGKTWVTGPLVLRAGGPRVVRFRVSISLLALDLEGKIDNPDTARSWLWLPGAWLGLQRI
ncbi:hypothetical protein DSO57_1009251 [Entomophthora muscae]|uniref:Uncharacterized protein n=1 Tax=Entomophthora muscae TaxID=34485 RepID=A0ACC2UHR7_9FUNG|nr:hypothetical protein DSO57_1009251 [Entomophthora muscae]